MNDRGPEPPKFRSVDDGHGEPDEGVVSAVPGHDEGIPIPPPPPRPLANEGDAGNKQNQFVSNQGLKRRPRARTRRTALDLEDPRVRRELARRLEIQRLKREQAEREAFESQLNTATDSNVSSTEIDEGIYRPRRRDDETTSDLNAPHLRPDRVAPTTADFGRQVVESEIQVDRAPRMVEPELAPDEAPQTSSQAIAERPQSEISDVNEAQPKSGIGRFILRSFLLFIVPLAAILVGLWFYFHGGRYIVTENAYLKADIIAVSADLAGRVTSVAVEDNEHVVAGQLLFTIDDRSFELEVSEAEADLAVIVRDVESLRGAYREALMENRQVQKRIEFAEREFERQQQMRQRQIGTGKEFDRAESDLDIAKSEGRVYRERVARALADLGGSDDVAAEEHPRYKRALAALAVAKDRLDRTKVTAATDGIVSNMRLQPGEWVDEGKPVFSIIDANDLWIEANLKETQLTNIVEGQLVSFTVDAYPNVDFSAVVDRIAPATGAEFALLPPQNATGNWVKVVQRVPTRLKIVVDDDAPTLRAGMTAKVKIDSEKKRVLPAWLVEADTKFGFPNIVKRYLGMSE